MLIKRTEGAFTLVELIICIGILSIIAAIIMPHLQRQLAYQERKRLTRILYNSIKSSQSSALIYHSNIVLCPSQDALQCESNPQYWNNSLLIFLDKNKNRRVDTNEHIIAIENLNLKYGNFVWRGTLSMPSLTFRADNGLPIGSNGSFYYCSHHYDHHLRIFLSKMGHLRQQEQTTTVC